MPKRKQKKPPRKLNNLRKELKNSRPRKIASQTQLLKSKPNHQWMSKLMQASLCKLKLLRSPMEPIKPRNLQQWRKLLRKQPRKLTNKDLP